MPRARAIQGAADRRSHCAPRAVGADVLVRKITPGALRFRRGGIAALFPDERGDRGNVRARATRIWIAGRGAEGCRDRDMASGSEILRRFRSNRAAPRLVLRRLASARVETRRRLDELFDHRRPASRRLARTPSWADLRQYDAAGGRPSRAPYASRGGNHLPRIRAP